MQVFRKGFSQTVRKRLGHDRVILIVVLFKTLRQFFGSMAGGYGKGADVIEPAAVTRRDEVGERQLRLAALTFFLLAQRVKPL